MQKLKALKYPWKVFKMTIPPDSMNPSIDYYIIADSPEHCKRVYFNHYAKDDCPKDLISSYKQDCKLSKVTRVQPRRYPLINIEGYGCGRDIGSIQDRIGNYLPVNIELNPHFRVIANSDSDEITLVKSPKALLSEVRRELKKWYKDKFLELCDDRGIPRKDRRKLLEDSIKELK